MVRDMVKMETQGLGIFHQRWPRKDLQVRKMYDKDWRCLCPPVK